MLWWQTHVCGCHLVENEIVVIDLVKDGSGMGFTVAGLDPSHSDVRATTIISSALHLDELIRLCSRFLVVCSSTASTSPEPQLPMVASGALNTT
jgi:hypothetical protein